MHGAIPSLPQYVFMACYGLKKTSMTAVVAYLIYYLDFDLQGVGLFIKGVVAYLMTLYHFRS
jgi:hypothetical protein